MKGVTLPANTKRMIVPNMSASNRFETGPAKAMRNSPCLLFFRLYGLYGTGLAQPKVKPANEVMMGTIIEPIGSICLIGFMVSRPAYLAVGSPRASAARPWETSWTTMENIRTNRKNRVDNICLGMLGIDLYKRYDSMCILYGESMSNN